MATALDLVMAALAGWLDQGGKPFVLGVCGAQGSGKSTLCDGLVHTLAARGIAAATLSLDDLYLTRAERAQRGRDIHPLFATRGVPGTHDVALGLALCDDFAHGRALHLPRFDKAIDDRAPQSAWTKVPAGVSVLIFEGWCVGARPQAADELVAPVNRLERDEDPQAVWRGHVNARLAGDYQPLFAAIDRLVLLAAPDFAVVERWRGEQEAALRARDAAPGAMDAAALHRFIAHYERLTRHILREMPGRADLTLGLSASRAVLSAHEPLLPGGQNL